MAKYKTYPEYKDSGVEWLGEIPRHWEILSGKRMFQSMRTLAYKCDEQLAASQKYGVIPQSLMMQLNDSKVMLALKGTDFFRHVEANNFVISLRSFEGGIEYSRYTGCVSPAYTVLKNSKPISHGYYRYIFKSTPFIAALQSSTDSLRDGKSINYEQFSVLNLPLTSIQEQNVIAVFLDHETAKIDNLIEKQQQLIELLKEKRQAVISHAVTKGLNSDAPMKDSGVEWLGEIPDYWELSKVRYKFSFGKGLTITKEHLLDEGVPCLNYGEIHSRYGFEVDPRIHLLKRVSNNYLKDHTDSLLLKGDIIFADTSEDLEGSGNFTQLISDDRVFAGYHTIIIRPYIRNNFRFYAYLLDCQELRTQIRNSVKGVKVFSVTQAILRNISIWLPSENEQKNIANFLDYQTAKIDTLIDKQLQQIELLKERRTALISAAVTGKIDVRDWVAPESPPQTVEDEMAEEALA
ncbi:restriction endonuclease subunit S [Lelliottia sp. CFBP8978]|uniref:restriction endonuclease subunit S n=1 Tax=Lelliottia sp. CFBP8978 TaxID=3096522 RepID=UPI002A6B6539|nr:restriction endonuclease subunit S [Lelliottia sp. CFBP8978]MDY1037145.1 restriction endonuclease subunit S [Lelliottia sp. CFBP8978]